MNSTSNQVDGRVRSVGRTILRLGLPALLAMAVVTAAASVPASARTPKKRKPGAPTAVTVLALNGAAGVSWAAPVSDGGSPITGYVATSSHGGRACTTPSTTTTCIINGLTNGRHYTIRVQASNIVGLGRAARVATTPGTPNCTYVGPYADLQSCDLSNANLADDDLTDANVTGANLTFATLTSANLTGANLTDANATAADLADANLTDANLAGADLFAVISGGITGSPSTLPSGWMLTDGYLVGPNDDLTDADLADANLTGADLSGAHFLQANLTGTNLTDANLTGANLSSTNLTDANLGGATLTGIIWSNTTCPDGTNSDADGSTCVNNLG